MIQQIIILTFIIQAVSSYLFIFLMNGKFEKKIECVYALFAFYTFYQYEQSKEKELLELINKNYD